MNIIPSLSSHSVEKVVQTYLTFNVVKPAYDFTKGLSEKSIDIITEMGISKEDNSYTEFQQRYNALDKDKINQISTDVEKCWNKPHPRKYIEFLRVMRNGKKIQSIKSARSTWPLGLKEAKEFVEEYWEPYNQDNHMPSTLRPIYYKEFQIELDTLSESYPEYII